MESLFSLNYPILFLDIQNKTNRKKVSEMNYHETRAMELLENNDLVDAVMCYIDSAEDYCSKADLISLSRVHLELGFVSEKLGM